jgi:hypothetical protein
MKLSSRELKDFFVACLLGDAGIHNGSFYIKQISKDLVYFKYNLIRKNFPEAKIKVLEYDAYIDKNGVNHQKYWQLYMSPNEYMKKLEKEFYVNSKKIIPEKYLRGLSLLAYSIWYADDGTTILVQKNPLTGSSKSRRVQFCTDCFSSNEVYKLQEMISKEFGKTSLVKRKEGVYRIQINGKDAQKFIVSISQFFYDYFPSLLYKMDLGYRSSTLESKYVSKEYKELYFKISAHSEFVDRMANR